MSLGSSLIAFRASATDDAGKPTRIAVRPFAPWKPTRSFGLPEVLLPLAVFLLALCGVVILAAFQGPWIIAVLLFSPMATTWIGAVIVLVLWALKAWPRQLVRSRAAALYQEKRCPACNYELPQSSPQHTLPESTRNGDLLTQCPECGAKWCLVPPGPTKRMTVVVGPAPTHTNAQIPNASPRKLDRRENAG